MRCDYLKDAAQNLVSNFPLGRRQKLRFKNQRPRDKFCRNFQKRHAGVLSFRKPCNQDARRYIATNAEVLTQHQEPLERLITEHNIDAKRIINLDESGMLADKYNVRRSRHKVYCVSKERPDPSQAQFKNVNRITLMACAHAGGDVARPMFVLQGTRMRYRKVRGTDGKKGWKALRMSYLVGLW